MKNGQEAKILLVHSAIAKSRKTQKPERFLEGVDTAIGTREPERFVCPMREVPIIIDPAGIEPWGIDIREWIRAKIKDTLERAR
jgi:hypothetical protein